MSNNSDITPGRPVSFRSIHDIITNRDNLSDPTGAFDESPVPPLTFRQKPQQTSQREPPLNPVVKTAPNLRYVSIHDVLTSRENDSDPTGRKG